MMQFSPVAHWTNSQKMVQERIELDFETHAMRSEKRTLFPQEPQLFALFWVFTHVSPHNDGVGDVHAINTG